MIVSIVCSKSANIAPATLKKSENMLLRFISSKQQTTKAVRYGRNASFKRTLLKKGLIDYFIIIKHKKKELVYTRF